MRQLSSSDSGTITGRLFGCSRKRDRDHFLTQLAARKRNLKWDTVQMVTEHALLPVISGRENEFEIAFSEAIAIITSIPGCRNVSLSRSIESPSTYLLLVEWDHLDDHMIRFRQSERYEQWRDLLHHFYEPFPVVEHYQAVL